MKICKIGIMFVCIYITIKIKFMYNRTQLNMLCLMASLFYQKWFQFRNLESIIELLYFKCI